MPDKRRKKSLVGWAERNWQFRFSYSLSCASISIARKREKPNDKKVRITIEELK